MSNSRSISALRAVLPLSTQIDVITQGDVTAWVKIAGRRSQLIWVGEGWMAQVKPAISLASSKYAAIFAARQMSPGAQKLLRDRHINWVDETGAAEIAIGTVVVSRSGHRPADSRKSNRWTPAVLSVAEALLCAHPATVSAMAQITQLSVGSCTSALRFLAEQGHLTSKQARGRESARTLVNRTRLLEDYASATLLFPPKASLAIGVSWKDPAKELANIGKKWTQSKVQWMATGEMAANILAPLLTHVAITEVYLSVGTIAQLEAASRLVGLSPIPGGRLILKTTPTQISEYLTTRKNSLVIAPWPRVYADLRETGVRGEEAAEHLKDVMFE